MKGAESDLRLLRKSMSSSSAITSPALIDRPTSIASGISLTIAETSAGTSALSRASATPKPTWCVPRGRGTRTTLTCRSTSAGIEEGGTRRVEVSHRRIMVDPPRRTDHADPEDQREGTTCTTVRAWGGAWDADAGKRCHQRGIEV